jgi:iron-sulfur cluster assembly accessory protein
MDILLTDSAANRIKTLCAEHTAKMVRLSVEGGGCSGFQYVFGFANAPEADDRVFEHNGAALVVDGTSLPLMVGSTLDFIDNLSGAHFKVNNPNAQSSCGCGTSFSVG